MKVYIYYRRDLYDTEHDAHNIRDRMIQISYDVFSLYKIAKDINKYMQDNELVMDVIFEYNLPFFDDSISKEIEAFRKDITRWKRRISSNDHSTKTVRN